jgi:hypothetical protein
MSLQALLNSPSGGLENLLLWSFAHAQQHQAVVDAIRVRTGTALPYYELDPINVLGVQEWLFRHQQAHNDFNGALGLPGDDLSVNVFDDEIALQAWLFQNMREHQAANALLNI